MRPTTEQTGQEKPRSRVPLWDNARFVLIVLVVIGHTVETLRAEEPSAYLLYAYVYFFHMPAMLALSGMFSRPEASPKVVRSTLQLLVTWLVWEVAWIAIKYLVEGEAPGDDVLTTPSWTLWFLVTLATLRIMLPYLARLRHPLVVSILVALGAGLSPSFGAEFSFSRTLCFLPFFVAGWLIRERGWLSGAWFTAPGPRSYGLAVLGLAVVAGALIMLQYVDAEWRVDEWLFGRNPYGEIIDEAPIADL